MVFEFKACSVAGTYRFASEPTRRLPHSWPRMPSIRRFTAVNTCMGNVHSVTARARTAARGTCAGLAPTQYRPASRRYAANTDSRTQRHHAALPRQRANPGTGATKTQQTPLSSCVGGECVAALLALVEDGLPLVYRPHLHGVEAHARVFALWALLLHLSGHRDPTPAKRRAPLSGDAVHTHVPGFAARRTVARCFLLPSLSSSLTPIASFSHWAGGRWRLLVVVSRPSRSARSSVTCDACEWEQ